VRLLPILAAASALGTATPAGFVASHQQPDGGFAEEGGHSSPETTAWAVLGLVSAGKTPGPSAASYLATAPTHDATDVALRVLTLAALHADTSSYLGRLIALRRPDGRIGPLVNSTIWGALAFRAVGRPVGTATVRYLIRRQRPSGGWAWYPGGAPDSDDTATAIEALRAAGVGGRPVRRGLAYLRKLQRSDGGFPLAKGHPSDSQSTAWAVQAFLAAGKRPPPGAFAFLARMRRRDGSYRYSRRYAVTPVWVTAQVLPALMRKPFPLR
jgi:Prenyltransferase and squalene oxidase repeat